MTISTGVNLVMAAGVVYGVVGALIMLYANRALYRTAVHIVAGYPRVLAGLAPRRHDLRFGLGMLACGSGLQALAALGYNAPLSLWRYPLWTLIAALLTYGVLRFATTRRAADRRAHSASGKAARELFQTRRSVRLREAAQLEAANLNAREIARHPRDTGVVYLAREWERRWWTERLGVSTEVLRAALRQVGPMTKDVERFLAAQSREGRSLAA